jgi:hypothetical protein
MSLWGPTCPIDNGSISPKQTQEQEAYHSPPSSAKGMNAAILTFMHLIHLWPNEAILLQPLYAVMAWTVLTTFFIS